MMRSIILIFSFLCVAYFAVQRFIHPQLNHNSILDRLQHPIDQRLRYRIGFIDPRFQLDTVALRQITQEAANIWENQTQQKYFVYDPNARLTINLIFDERQNESNYRKHTLKQFENSKSLADQMRLQLEQESQQLEFLKQQIEQQQHNYSNDLDQHNNFVHHINGLNTSITDSQLQQINNSKTRLTQQKLGIESNIERFNILRTELNDKVEKFNQSQHQQRKAINEFNQVFQAKMFHKGEFNGREINIYEFQSIDELRITLAHEFGHALGLQHTNDPNALMYPILEKQNFSNFKLTTADLELLKSR
ncbi:matrixin family metalloprotease [Acinetobacter sp. DSM 11652]|uniref:matrixin family metalloprotease n=1 Tax=Acinetobacter sp. DSM 11652 TaxID=346222 RepID=UPI0008BA8921|nr:matrixin family metalloprotease [Acinetobacter sp. DSM 11652]SEM29502.1 Matrixin [Acinetobacter sp. DSM 11652]